MAYFKSNDPNSRPPYTEDDMPEEEYNDGFDELTEDDREEPELSEEERLERRDSRRRLAVGAGNLFGVISGTVLILLLLTLIFSMVHFVINDLGKSISLFQTNF